MVTRIAPMGLMFGAILFLAVPGIIYNNFTNSNLTPAGAPNLVCNNADAPSDTCQGSTAVGCQASSPTVNACTFNGYSISFLNSKSPFTQLIQGNLFALFNNLNPLGGGGGATTQGSQTSWSGTHGPFDITGNPIYYSADCRGQPNIVSNSRSQTSWAVQWCTQTNTDNSNVTIANGATWPNWNTKWNTSLSLIFVRPDVANATFPQTCSEIAQINYTALGGQSFNTGYTYFGCHITQGSSQYPNSPTHRAWGMLIAMPVSYGIMPAGFSHQHLFVQLTPWYTQNCAIGTVNLGPYASQQCENFRQGFKGITLPCMAASCPTFVPNQAGAIVFGFLAGIILLLGGLGLQLGMGGGVSAGVNMQGTRLFQVLGLGLIMWTFFYSQFSTWFTSSILPNGLDGSVGIISISLSSMFFAGVLWQVTSAEGGD